MTANRCAAVRRLRATPSRAGRLVDSLDRTTYFTLSTRTSSSLRDVIPEVDIWRTANLMLKRYGDAALVERAKRADELAAAGDTGGAAVWCRIIDAVDQLSNTTPPGPVH
jgi:hypothetical protein